ncbi:MAG: hypothetical protein ACREBH_02690 [Candidatus Micrarchaeaceae archaeon]
MLDNIKRFYTGYSIYEYAFFSALVGISATVMFRAAELQTGYGAVYISGAMAVYAAVFVGIFIATLLSLLLSKPKVRFNRNERLLLVAHVFVSLAVAFVVL